MTHPFIDAALDYRRAQAVVLKEAEAFEAAAAKDPGALLDAVREMKKARARYAGAKAAVRSETQDSSQG